MRPCITLSVACVVCLLQSCLVSGQGFTTCTYSTDCTGYTNLGAVNLTLASAFDPYATTNPANQDAFYWKPCEDFLLSGITAGAVQQPTGSYSQDLGIHSQASCLAEGGYLLFSMLSRDKRRTSYVRCLCGTGNVLQYETENPLNTFYLNFTSQACCPVSGHHSQSSISIGSLIIIIFFTLLVLYIVLGTVFQVSVMKAQGRERIPNVSLWSTIPGLIRDGFLFTFTCGRHSGYGKI
ncbi:hypothetical protein BsWGS_01750 [Bradybaena similaris]